MQIVQVALRDTRDRSITHKLTKMIFEKNFNLTAGVYVILYVT